MTDRMREILQEMVSHIKFSTDIFNFVEVCNSEIDQALQDIKQEMVKGVLSVEEVAKIIREFKIGLDGKRYEDDFPDKLALSIHEAQVKKLEGE